MRRITIRLPESIVGAYDAADGNRSALMRRRLKEAVAEGELSGVPDDLQVLAEAEAAAGRGKLNRKRGKFKERCYDFFRDRWESGAVTPADADSLAESWRDEGAIYGAECLAFVETVVEWYDENFNPANMPPFPPAERFVANMSPDDCEVPERLARVVEEGFDRGLSEREIVARISKFHDDEQVQTAVALTDGGNNGDTDE